MCIKIYTHRTSRFELYQLLKEGLDAVTEGKTQPYQDALEEIRQQRKWIN